MFSQKKEIHRAMTYDNAMSECVDTLWCFQCNSHESTVLSPDFTVFFTKLDSS